jgi:hypothetical protein
LDLHQKKIRRILVEYADVSRTARSVSYLPKSRVQKNSNQSFIVHGTVGGRRTSRADSSESTLIATRLLFHKPLKPFVEPFPKGKSWSTVTSSAAMIYCGAKTTIGEIFRVARGGILASFEDGDSIVELGQRSADQPEISQCEASISRSG